MNKQLEPKKLLKIVLGTLIAIIGGVTFLALAAFYWSIYPHNKPPSRVADLGPGLEFVDSTTDRTCIFIYCDDPSATYYFATDMSTKELQGYFKGARYTPPPRRVEYPSISNQESPYTTLEFEVPDRGNFSVDYYDDTKTITRTDKLKSTHKAHIISIYHTDYERAKSAL